MNQSNPAPRVQFLVAPLQPCFAILRRMQLREPYQLELRPVRSGRRTEPGRLASASKLTSCYRRRDAACRLIQSEAWEEVPRCLSVISGEIAEREAPRASAQTSLTPLQLSRLPYHAHHIREVQRSKHRDIRYTDLFYNHRAVCEIACNQRAWRKDTGTSNHKLRRTAAQRPTTVESLPTRQSEYCSVLLFCQPIANLQLQEFTHHPITITLTLL